MSGARRLLVIGSGGQDGTILTAAAVAAGDHVVGIGADGGIGIFSGETWGSLPASAPVSDPDRSSALIEAGRFDEIHYLAAHHGSSERMGSPIAPASWDRSWAVHCAGLIHVLDAVLRHSHRTHVVYASSCHAFGVVAAAPQNETTPLRPTTPYGVTKAAGMGICAAYRAAGARASAAILYNHESPLRRATFVSQRIADAVASAVVANAPCAHVMLRDPDAIVDWLSADDAVRALRAIGALDTPEDFVVASGVPRTVRELGVAAAASRGLAFSCSAPDLDVTDIARPEAARRRAALVGDAARLRAATGWAPRVPFTQWVGLMVDAAIRRLENMQDSGNQ